MLNVYQCNSFENVSKTSGFLVFFFSQDSEKLKIGCDVNFSTFQNIQWPIKDTKAGAHLGKFSAG